MVHATPQDLAEKANGNEFLGAGVGLPEATWFVGTQRAKRIKDYPERCDTRANWDSRWVDRSSWLITQPSLPTSSAGREVRAKKPSVTFNLNQRLEGDFRTTNYGRGEGLLASIESLIGHPSKQQLTVFDSVILR
ncbi:hypothetical protein J6590_008923 [Homalodisca vitripennis]|nr:hypothetical protein J6590_008923 [Homalodisca vitripennis]